jgi:ribosomal 30S subunit maturation factor RimM
MATSDLWTFRDQTFAGTSLTGFTVEATDGDIGKVDEATNEVGASFIVVDTGPWIFGKKVMLPAGVIDRVDHDDKRIFVDRTKDEIKNAPEFDESRYRDEQYRTELGGYYTGTMGRGFDEPL